MEMDKHTERTIQMIHQLLKDKHTFETWYSLPYSSSDDDVVDVVIKYKVNKVKIWKVKDKECLFEGTIYIQPTNLRLGVNDEWEEGFKQHDIYESKWDELGEEITDEVMSVLPHVCIDYDFDFTKLNS